MANYTAEELRSDGVLSEALSASPHTFTLTNPSGSAYFSLETIHKGDGEYDLTSPQNTKGEFSGLIGVQSLIQSPYIASFEVEKGISYFIFTPDSPVSDDSLFLRATGDISLTIS